MTVDVDKVVRFGSLVMAALDGGLISVQEDPAGERVKITFNGKWLPHLRF